MSNNNLPPGVGGSIPGGQAPQPGAAGYIPPPVGPPQGLPPQGGQVPPPAPGGNMLGVGWPIIPDGWPPIPGGQAPPPPPAGNNAPAGWPDIPGELSVTPGGQNPAPGGQNPENPPNNPENPPNNPDDPNVPPEMFPPGSIPNPGDYPQRTWGPPVPPGPGEMLPDNRPRTPWAERFGRVDSMFYHMDPSSSGFSPQYPKLDPKYHGDIPSDFPFPPGWVEFDKYIYNHSLQARHFEGGRTWQIPAFHAELSLADNKDTMKGGNTEDCRAPEAQKALRERYDRETIEVNEDTWFSFFRKDRWFAPKLREDVFSVDRDEVWAELRFILELANRILKTLVEQKHEWMDTIMWGTVALWSEVKFTEPYEKARVLLPHRVEAEFCRSQGMMPMNPSMIDSPKEVYFAEWEKLLDDLVWTFSENSKVSAWGYFTILKRQPSIWLETGQFQSLLEEDLTIAERTLIVVNIAFTICHEIMHATMRSRLVRFVRVTEYAKITKEEVERGAYEPFYNFESIAEIGESWENAVFGGVLNNLPGPIAERALQRGRPDQHLIPMNCTVKEWPSRITCLSYLGSPKCALDLEDIYEKYSIQSKVSHVPIAYQYMLLGKDFWDTDAVKDFHMPDIFLTTQDNSCPTGYHALTEVRMDSEFLPAHNNTLARFDERVARWTEASSRIPGVWMEDWSASPWGDFKRRRMVDEFRRAFTNRRELICRDISSALVASLQEGDPEAMPKTGSRENFDWLFCIIGLIMKAALPIRRKEYCCFKEVDWLRAQPAQQAGAAGKNFTIWAVNWDYGFDLVPQTELCHPLTGSDIDDPNHNSFLDAAESLMDAADQIGTDQPALWIETLQDAIANLRQQRQTLTRIESWADTFPWMVPEYDGAVYVRYIPGRPFHEPFNTKYKYIDE
ncbi:hypothetical protein F4775DRAFT_595043 [Biscogniauxia sp. FL1348]|nr:hypothetical protein F4775DRAFT_595043 [Biscogniauxia sp. FL1348]